jgi:hypothetical protein
MDFTIADLLKNVFYFGGLSAITAIIISPLQFLKVIRQQTGAQYSEICQKYFKEDGLKPFFRGAIPYAKLQFYSSSAFGLNEFFMVMILKQFGLEVTLIGILIRALSAGVTETAFTVNAEVKEISRNKGELMKQDGTIKSIIESIFLRNVLFWMGSLFTLYFINKANLSNFSGGILAFMLGIVIAIVTIPIDMAATHNCGDDTKYSTFKRIKKIIQDGGGYSSSYYGSLMRIIQIAIFTLVTSITEMILR